VGGSVQVGECAQPSSSGGQMTVLVAGAPAQLHATACTPSRKMCKCAVGTWLPFAGTPRYQI
jgi:hypothetical protein